MGAGNNTFTPILGNDNSRLLCVCREHRRGTVCCTIFGNSLWRTCMQTPLSCAFSFCSRGVNCRSCGVAHLHSMLVILAGVQGVLMGCSLAPAFSNKSMSRLTFQTGPARREDVSPFPWVGMDHGGMSNHRESSCFHTEKLQLHDVSLKAAEPPMVASVACATAHLSEHCCPSMCICQA